MKIFKVLFIIFLFIATSCTTLGLQPATITCREGLIVFSNEEYFYFKCSKVIVNENSVIITTPHYTATFSWDKIRTIHIYNSCNQDTYKEHLKRIKELLDQQNSTTTTK